VYSVIGIGGVGCRIAKCFSEYPQYNVICVDDQSSGIKDQIIVPKQKTSEEYEESFKNLTKAKKDKIKDNVVVVLCGASLVSSIALRLLYQIRNKNITVICVRPEQDLMGETKQSQEKVIYSVLQEYTRSGIFDRIYLTSNSQMDSLVEDASIKEYYPAINKMIASVFHMVMVFDHQDPVISNFSNINEARRICTLGILDIEKSTETMFFPFEDAMETRLYYGISKETLKSDKSLQRNIIKLIKDKNKELCKYSYGVYETQYDWDFCYTKYFSSKVQDF
jgi:translation elongation factor EF-G